MLVVGNTDPLFVKKALVSVHLQISLACDYCWNIFYLYQGAHQDLLLTIH